MIDCGKYKYKDSVSLGQKNPVPPEYNWAFRNGRLYQDRLVDLNLQIQKQNSFFVLLQKDQTQFHSWSPK